MRLSLLLQQLIPLAIAGSVQSHVAPRTFKFQGPREGQSGVCSAAEVEIILEEIAIAKEAAEFAAEHLTQYPFFRAFQEPSAFGEQELEKTGREVFTRVAAMLDGFFKDERFTIECRSARCAQAGYRTAAIMSTKRDGTLDPILSFCPIFFDTDASSKKKLERYKKKMGNYRHYVDMWSGTINMQDLSRSRSTVVLHELTHTTYVAMPIKELLGRQAESELFISADHFYDAVDCYKMARGYHDSRTKTLRKPEPLTGAMMAAENAESWALIASGMYMSNQLRIKQIPIRGIADYRWEKPRSKAQ